MIKIAICSECEYQSITLLDECSKCAGKLEILAEERT